MSFSSEVKNELCRLNIEKQCCLVNELKTVITLNLQKKLATNIGKTTIVSTENALLARRLFSLTKVLYNYSPEIIIKKSKSLKKHALYLIAFDSPEFIKHRLLETTISPSSLKDCCKRAVLRGAFLASGSITDPKKSYHLEISTHDEDLENIICEILKQYELNPKMIIRKTNHVIYIKEIKNLEDFLNLIKAHSSALELKNVQILKGMRNSVNRIVNCETANLEKVINTSMRQIEDIKYIKNAIGFEKLPKTLREIAKLRVKHSEASLKELGEMLSPSLGKSGVNHRLKKLEQIAENIRNLKGECK